MAMPLSLRPTAGADKEPESLTRLVDRIYREKGHMRYITEESLRAEIAQEEANDDASMESDNEEAKDDDPDARVKELWEARQEIFDYVTDAHNDALTLLDFVSLLISKDDAARGASGMSPALKEMTAPGTLAFDKTEVLAPSSAQKQQAEAEATGLNFQNLAATADRLLDSATRLEEEMTKETRYWQQILSVTEKGWNITKVRGQAHALGIRFACSEAAPAFQAKGLASLQPGEDGSLNLESRVASEAKSICVSIKENGIMTATSHVPTLLDENAELERLVHQARDSLFDEELFHELRIEARNLLAYGVRARSSSITIPLDFSTGNDTAMKDKVKREIVIDFVDREVGQAGNNDLAGGIALYLRLGLNHAYRERHKRRTRPPPPLSNNPQNETSFSVIKPMLCLVSHERSFCGLEIKLSHLLSTLTNAGVECRLETSRNLKWKHTDSGKKPVTEKAAARSAMDRLFAQLMGLQTSTLTFSLKTSSVVLNATTSIGPPHYGTCCTIDAIHPGGDDPAHRDFTSVEEALSAVQDVLRRKISRDLAADIPGLEFDGQTGDLVGSLGGHKKRRMALMITNGKLGVRALTAEGKVEVVAAWDGEAFRGKVRVEGKDLKAFMEHLVKSAER